MSGSANKYHPPYQLDIGGPRDGIFRFEAPNGLVNLGRGMEWGGGYQSSMAPIAIEQAWQQVSLKAQAMAQLPNQSFVDELRLKIASIQNQIHMATMIHPPGSVDIAGLFQEEAKFKQKLYQYLIP